MPPPTACRRPPPPCRHPANAAARFAGVYPLHDQGTAFTTPAELLGTLGLYDLTQDNLLQYWREHIGTSASAERFASELLGAVTRANYNQGNEEVNALAGLVSALPATGARSRGPWPWPGAAGPGPDWADGKGLGLGLGHIPAPLGRRAASELGPAGSAPQCIATAWLAIGDALVADGPALWPRAPCT